MFHIFFFRWFELHLFIWSFFSTTTTLLLLGDETSQCEIMMNQENVTILLSNNTNNRINTHAKIFYSQIIFTIITFILGTRALLSSHIPFFAWLPALLLLFDATLSFASLLYLDFTHKNTASYLRLVLSLVIFRFSCAIVLMIELFVPHSDPTVSIPLIIVSLLHCTFSLLSTVQVYNLTTPNIKTNNEEIGLKMEPCHASTTTLITNIEEDIE